MELFIPFLAYLIIIVIIGMWTTRTTQTQADFLLGGQKLPSWAIAISERASGESAWLILGLPGVAFAYGLSQIWSVTGCIAGILFLWFFLGERVRRQLQGLTALTLPEFLAQRFGDPYKIIRLLAALIIFFFFTFYVSAQIGGAGKLFAKMGILPQSWQIAEQQLQLLGTVIGAVIVILYTLLGGFQAVVWTDLLQGIIMAIACLLLPIMGMFELTNTASMMQALEQAGASKVSLVAGKEGWAAIIVVLSGLSWGLGYIGQPHLLTRFMAFRRPEDVKNVRWLASIWTFIAYGGAFSIGLIALGLFGANELQALGDSEKIMPHMAITLLPMWLAGIVIAGAMAAMMSTADSQLLVVTSAVSEDIVYRIAGKELSTKAQVLLSRIVVVVVGIAAFVMALKSKETIYNIVSLAWSGLGASFGPAMLLMVTWPRFNRYGVIASLLTGSVTTVVWKTVIHCPLGISERLAAFIIALFTAWLTSLLTSIPSTSNNHD